MKMTYKRIINIESTLDSSEAVVFNQGGKHTLKISLSDVDFDSFDEINFSVQMERNHQSNFDFVNNEAAKHRKQWDEINKLDVKDQEI
jgi:hypothetical protein